VPVVWVPIKKMLHLIMAHNICRWSEPQKYKSNKKMGLWQNAHKLCKAYGCILTIFHHPLKSHKIFGLGSLIAFQALPIDVLQWKI